MIERQGRPASTRVVRVVRKMADRARKAARGEGFMVCTRIVKEKHQRGTVSSGEGADITLEMKLKRRWLLKDSGE